MSAALDPDRIVFGCGNFGGMGSSPALRHHGDAQRQALALLNPARDLDLACYRTER